MTATILKFESKQERVANLEQELARLNHIKSQGINYGGTDTVVYRDTCTRISIIEAKLREL